MKRFYCMECDEPKKRFEVSCDDFKGIYYCNKCGSPVMQTRYIMEDLMADYIEYIKKNGKEEDYY